MRRLLLSLFLALSLVSIEAQAQPVWQATDSQTTPSGTGNDWIYDQPTNLVEGNMILFVGMSFDSLASASSSIGLASGFTLIRSEHDTSATSRPEVVAACKIATGSEPSTYTFTSSELLVAGLHRVTNHSGSCPTVHNGNNSSGTTQTGAGTLEVNGVTAPDDDGLLVVAVGLRGVLGDTTPFTNFATTTERINQGAGDLRALGVGTETLTSAGATGTRTIGWTAEGATRSTGLSFVISPPAASSGEYDTAPTVTDQSTTAYTVTGSLDAAGDVHGVVCPIDQTAPTISQVQAGDCTGDVNAEATDTDSPSTGNFDFSLTLTPTFEFGDIYVTDGTTLTTLADEYLDPASDCGENSDRLCQFIDITSVGSGSVVEDFNNAQNPDIASPDKLIAPVSVSPGITGTHTGSDNASTLTDSEASWPDDIFIGSIINNDTDGSLCTITDNTATTQVCTLTGGTDDDWDTGDEYTIESALTITAAGHFSYPGDGTQQRAFNIKIYDVSAEGYHAEDIDFLDNNEGPFCNNEVTPIMLTENSAMTAIDWDTFASDPDGDTLTYALTTGTLPAGTSLGGTGNDTYSGTPTTADHDGVEVDITATDEGALTCVLERQIYVIDEDGVTVPDYTTDDFNAATTLHQTTFPWQAAFPEGLLLESEQACDESEAADEVTDQDPAASSLIDPFDTVTVTVSTGECPLGKRTKGVTLPGVSIGN